MDENRIPVAGDPFYAVSRHHDEQEPCGCYGGYHYIGHMVEGEDGDEVEIFEPVPCERCTS